MIIDEVLKLLHVCAIVVWIGGMVFVYFFLRPSLAELETSLRLRLMHGVLQRFFNVVQWLVLVVLSSGVWMIGRAAKASVQAGLGFAMPLNWTMMATLGVLMILIFGHMRFALFARLGRAVTANDTPAADATLRSLRMAMGINLAVAALIMVVTFVLV